MTETLLARIADLKSTPTADLKSQWRELFGKEPPPYNRNYLQSRLAYRIQELSLGGLKPQTIARLEALGEALDGGKLEKRKIPAASRLITGTQLIREYQGVPHTVIVRDTDFVYEGRPYKSLSAIARAITGTRWNGLMFFGLKRKGDA
jgi:hypothetical protein